MNWDTLKKDAKEAELKKPKGPYRGLPQVTPKLSPNLLPPLPPLPPLSRNERFKQISQPSNNGLWLSGIIVNGALSIMNIILFLYFGGHWYSMAAAIFCGSVAIYFTNRYNFWKNKGK